MISALSNSTAATTAARPPRRTRLEDDTESHSFACTYPSKDYAMRPNRAHLPIHRSAWKDNSANFAFTEFYEVRLSGFVSVFLLRIVSEPVIKALSHTPPAAYPAMTSLK